MNAMNLIYFDTLMDPVMLEILEADGGFAIDKRARHDDLESNIAALRQAHVYQINSAKDELPRPLWGEAPLFQQCPNLLLLSTSGAGYDVCDLEAATAAGVAVVNQAGGNKEGVAEHALAMMLTVAKKIIDADRATRKGGITDRVAFKGIELNDKTVGIIGIGHVGTRLAEMCRGLFNCRVLAYDPLLTAAEVKARGAEKVESLHEMVGECDFVSLNCPLIPTTRGMVDAGVFAAIKPGAIYVATARGYIHDEQALTEALASGHLAGAGLDVWDIEPPPVDHPILAMDNVIVSPHTAGVTFESRRNIAAITAEQLIAIRNGEKPPRLLNPEVWPQFQERFQAVYGIRPAD